MRWSRSEVNRLGDRIRERGLADDDRAKLLEYRATFLPAYERMVADIAQALPELKVTGRPEKTPDSIVAKLRRTKIELARMQDIAGCRLVVEQVRQQDEVVKGLSSIYPGARVVDRRVTPSFGYRAVHVIPTIEGCQVEIQVRSVLQHLWATLSERLADEIGAELKYGIAPPGFEHLVLRFNRMSAMVGKFEASGFGEDLINAHPDRMSALDGAFAAMMTLAMEDTT